MELRNLTVDWGQGDSRNGSKIPSFVLEETVAERPSITQETGVNENR